MEPEERNVMLADRREELRAEAENLRNTARLRWRNPLGTFALAAAGAGWLGAGPLHDPLGAVLATVTAGSALTGAALGQEPVTAYSYVFQAKRELGDRAAQ
jgi:hypothetical protein